MNRILKGEIGWPSDPQDRDVLYCRGSWRSGAVARKGGGPGPRAPAAEAVQKGLIFLHGHPLFSPLLRHAHVDRTEGNRCPRDGWAVVTINGVIHAHPKRRATPGEWIRVFAHCLLHLGFGHFRKRARQDLWNLACDAFVNRFLDDLKLGRRPVDIHSPNRARGSPTCSRGAARADGRRGRG